MRKVSLIRPSLWAALMRLHIHTKGTHHLPWGVWTSFIAFTSLSVIKPVAEWGKDCIKGKEVKIVFYHQNNAHTVQILSSQIRKMQWRLFMPSSSLLSTRQFIFCLIFGQDPGFSIITTSPWWHSYKLQAMESNLTLGSSALNISRCSLHTKDLIKPSNLVWFWFGLCCLMTPGLSKDIRCHVWPYIY